MTRPRSISRARVAELTARGLDYRQIAARLGCTPASVNRVRHELAGAAAVEPTAADPDAVFADRIGKAQAKGNSAGGSKVAARVGDSGEA